jgi:hypothetical protein
MLNCNNFKTGNILLEAVYSLAATGLLTNTRFSDSILSAIYTFSRRGIRCIDDQECQSLQQTRHKLHRCQPNGAKAEETDSDKFSEIEAVALTRVSTKALLLCLR